MDAEIKKYVKGWRFYAAVSLRRVVEVKGVNSKVDERTHFLMWDFDHVQLNDVIVALRVVQEEYRLPAISIVQTKADGFHAYCFKACTWEQARGIIAATEYVDKHYLAIGIGRGYFTLRISDVPGREFRYKDTLPSEYPSDLDYADVCSFVEYTRAR